MLFHTFLKQFNNSEYVIDQTQTTMYNEYNKGINGSNLKQLEYGLYLEFTRFVNCEWPLHILT